MKKTLKSCDNLLKETSNQSDIHFVITDCQFSNQRLSESNSFSVFNANLALNKIDLLAKNIFETDILPEQNINFEKKPKLRR